MAISETDKKYIIGIIEKYQDYKWNPLTLVNTIKVDMIMDGKKDFSGDQFCQIYTIERKSMFTWKYVYGNPTEDFRKLESYIQDTVNVLKRFGCTCDVQKYKTTQFEKSNERGINHNTKLIYHFPVSRKDDVLEFVQYFDALCVRKSAGSLLGKMENSEFAQFLAQKIFELHTANPYIRTIGERENNIKFAVLREWIHISRIGGENSAKRFVYKDYGYKDLSPEQQSALGGALLKCLSKKFKAFGAQYVYMNLNINDCYISLYFDPKKTGSLLKDW